MSLEPIGLSPSLRDIASAKTDVFSPATVHCHRFFRPQIIYHLPRDVMHLRSLCCRPVSVCPSRSCIVSRRLKISSDFLVPEVSCPYSKGYYRLQTVNLTLILTLFKRSPARSRRQIASRAEWAVCWMKTNSPCRHYMHDKQQMLNQKHDPLAIYIKCVWTSLFLTVRISHGSVLTGCEEMKVDQHLPLNLRLRLYIRFLTHRVYVFFPFSVHWFRRLSIFSVYMRHDAWNK